MSTVYTFYNAFARKRGHNISDPSADCILPAETMSHWTNRCRMLPRTGLFLRGGGYSITQVNKWLNIANISEQYIWLQDQEIWWIKSESIANSRRLQTACMKVGCDGVAVFACFGPVRCFSEWQLLLFSWLTHDKWGVMLRCENRRRHKTSNEHNSCFMRFIRFNRLKLTCFHRLCL